MQKRIRDIHDYYEVITKVWGFFRKFYGKYDKDEAIKSWDEIMAWSKFKGPRIYEFTAKLVKVVWAELEDIDNMRKENEGTD